MNMKMRKQQSGFTLIELVIVIVILGILAAVAIPRFVDLSDEAENATCDGINGGLLSTAAINLADPDVGSGTGSPGTLADIVNNTQGNEGAGVTNTVGNGLWAASTDASACTITVTLDNGTECSAAAEIPTDLATDCT